MPVDGASLELKIHGWSLMMKMLSLWMRKVQSFLLQHTFFSTKDASLDDGPGK